MVAPNRSNLSCRRSCHFYKGTDDRVFDGFLGEDRHSYRPRKPDLQRCSGPDVALGRMKPYEISLLDRIQMTAFNQVGRLCLFAFHEYKPVDLLNSDHIARGEHLAAEIKQFLICGPYI